MTTFTEAVLLGRAVEACCVSDPMSGGFHVHAPYPEGGGPHANEWMVSKGGRDFFGPTLTDALLALLAELGEPVELPSAEQVALWLSGNPRPFVHEVRLHDADPLLVAAVLDAGGGA